ncbi:MAG: hypothetical protein KC502_21625 [Myxococcales bacterium]|nr:hypothetical protein [Myxococcales bacterium]
MTTTIRPQLLLTVICLTLGCGRDLSQQETETLIAMAVPAEGMSRMASPSNAVADDPAAAALGQKIFFDKGFSHDGSVACASCHVADQGWSDDRAVSVGVQMRKGGRHSMPVLTAADQRWWFWDGRADSMWSQAIAAMESEDEMDFSRAEAAHYVLKRYGKAYAQVFGSVPNLSGVPARAKPGLGGWEQLSPTQRTRVERVFTNIGKALEAYERKLDCSDTRFDQWAKGAVTMTRQESEGAANFIREGCVDCHSGANFSDSEFHNIGIGSNGPAPDYGRQTGAIALALSPFNAAGVYSDDRNWGAARLKAAAAEQGTLGAFRTPSLRGVAQRRSFGHRGDHRTLRDFLNHYDRLRPQPSAVGQLDPLLRGVNVRGERSMEAFLSMLNCRPVPAALTAH